MSMYTEKELVRKRLKIIEYAQKHNSAKAYTYFGIPKSTFYDWLARYKQSGIDGLKEKYKLRLFADSKTVFALLFCAVEGHIGISEQGLPVIPMLSILGDPAGGCHLVVLFPNHKRVVVN